MSRLGHSRRGRANTKSGNVRCALKAEVRSIGHLERLSWVDGAARDVIEAPKLESWIVRYELSDFEWAAIKPFLPNKSRGVRRVISAGAQWHLLGSAFRRTMARSAGLLWPTHHLLQPFRPVAKSRSMRAGSWTHLPPLMIRPSK